MKFFKLELINRENSYNKMFNAQPNVGTLNLIDNNKVNIYIIFRNHLLKENLIRNDLLR